MRRRKIRLLYDGTLLTEGLNKGAFRSGIFMVVYHVFLELLTYKNIETVLYCPQERLENLKLFISLYVPEMVHKIRIINDVSYFDSSTWFDKSIDRVAAKRNMCCARNHYICRQLLNIVFLFQKTVKAISCALLKTLVSPQHLPVTWNQIDAALSPAFPHIPEVALRKRIKKYTILYDTIPYLFPDLFPDTITGKSWNLDLLYQLDAEDVCFAISEQTKKDYLYFSSLLRDHGNNLYRMFKSREGFPHTKSIIAALADFSKEAVDYSAHTTKLQSNNIEVAPLAAASRFYRETNVEKRDVVFEKYHIPKNKKYIFSLCTLERRKNLSYAIRNFLALVEEKHIDDLIFVLGGGGWSTYQVEFDSLLSLPGAKKLIYRIGYVDDEDVAVLFSNALCTVYPSIYEGFGLPVLEAMQCGCPVIASNSSSIPEVMGNAGMQIDVSSDAALKDCLFKLYSSPQICRMLSRQGLLRSKMFSWKKTGKIIVDRICKDFENRDYSVLPEEENQLIFENAAAKSSNYLTDWARMEGGFGQKEAWGVWTVAKKAVLSVVLPKEPEKMSLKVKVHAFGKVKYVDIFYGTGKIGHWDILNPSPENYFLDCSKLPREKEIQLTLENNEVSRPCDLMKGNTDDRTLGIGIHSISVEKLRGGQ